MRNFGEKVGEEAKNEFQMADGVEMRYFENSHYVKRWEEMSCLGRFEKVIILGVLWKDLT